MYRSPGVWYTDPDMPRRLTRNYWIELEVDGKTPVASGPRLKDGGFTLTIHMRDRERPDETKRALTITGRARLDELQLQVLDANGTTVLHDSTLR